MEWPALSAVAGSVAATTALLTLVRATGLYREGNRDRAATTRAVYYKALLTKPLARESDRLARLVHERGKQLLQALNATQEPAERDALVKAAIEEIHEGFLSFYHELRVATGAWQVDTLTIQLYRATQDWEDQAQFALNDLLGPSNRVEEIRKGCTAYRTALRRILFDADPVLLRERERDQPSNALLRFIRGI
jgi:DNA-directed RNA polymerase subunit K/omega